MLNIKQLSLDTVLVRTDLGTVAMRDRGSMLKPKLRAVLFLIDGESSLGKLLDNAGTLHNILLTQLEELLAKEMIRPGNTAGATAYDATATRPIGEKGHARPADLSPLMAAKMQLLNRLEILAGDEADLLGAELLDARSLSDLASNAKLVSIGLEPLVGVEAAQGWWTDAKAILVAWRDMPKHGE
jgi:hypothetical protein